jgi:hypothetical protein|tara:strand:+ start:1505 stop:1942 length:438 start_codon:yes stop_codon:yes gene_type:complete
MTTVLQIVNGAAIKATIKTAEIDLEAFEFQQILDEMNDLLSEWADSGLTPAFVEVSNSTDTVNIDRNAVSAVKNALAIRIAPQFSKPITQGMVLNANDSKSRLEASQIYIGEVAYPDSLPTGSGNECARTEIERRFYTPNKKDNF